MVCQSCGGTRHAPSLVPAPQPEQVELVVFLVGDAGEPARSEEPVLKALRAELAPLGPRGLTVFLGDNIYPAGLPDSAAPARAESERRLDAQLDAAVAAGARVVFVPGNHDWAGGGFAGWQAVRRQAGYVGHRGTAMYLPADGCPGPGTLDLSPRLRLVALDTEWWLQAPPRPPEPAAACPADSEGEVLDSLRVALAAGDRHVLVVTHHPVSSWGPHGGYFPWMDHVFPLRAVAKWLWIPLPIIGSAYPIARRSGISRQDFSNGDTAGCGRRCSRY